MVRSVDLVKEEYDYIHDNEDKFVILPKNQDNNNGILVIDLQEDEQHNIKIKYGFGLGYEENGDLSTMVNAKTYLDASGTMEYMKENNKEEYEIVSKDMEKQIAFIDNNFELLTDEEYNAMFDTEYEYAWNLDEVA